MILKKYLSLAILTLSVTILYGQTKKTKNKTNEIEMVQVHTLVDFTNNACFSWRFSNLGRKVGWDTILPMHSNMTKEIALGSGIDYGPYKIISMRITINKLTKATKLDHTGNFSNYNSKDETFKGDAKIVGNQLFFKSDKGNKKITFKLKYQGDTIISLQESISKITYEKIACQIEDDLNTIDASPTIVDYYKEEVPDPSLKETDVCTYCDTITLASDKPTIIAYYVESKNKKEGGYYNQPEKNRYEPNVKNNQGFNIYANTKDEEVVYMKEFLELKRPFNVSEINVYYLSKNTYIKFENEKSELIDLLNRSKVHKGFLYWSGKPKDNIKIYSTAPSVSTQIMQERQIKFSPTYLEDFKSDSTLLNNSLGQFKPSEEMKKASKSVVHQILVSEFGEVLQFQVYNYKGVKSIQLGKAFIFFNKDGYPNKVLGKDGDNEILCKYKENLLTEVIEKDNNRIDTLKISYNDNTLLVKDNYSVTQKDLFGQIIYQSMYYHIEPSNYQHHFLRHYNTNISAVLNGSFCVEMENQFANMTKDKECYSNAMLNLPYTIENTMDYADANGELVHRNYIKKFEKINGNELHYHHYSKDEDFSKRYIYTEKNGLPIQLTINGNETLKFVYTMY
jgi:hypothetical protein